MLRNERKRAAEPRQPVAMSVSSWLQKLPMMSSREAAKDSCDSSGINLKSPAPGLSPLRGSVQFARSPTCWLTPTATYQRGYAAVVVGQF